MLEFLLQVLSSISTRVFDLEKATSFPYPDRSVPIQVSFFFSTGDTSLATLQPAEYGFL